MEDPKPGMLIQPNLENIKQILTRRPVLLILSGKQCLDKGWPNFSYEYTQGGTYQYRLETATNIGVLLGERSANLCAIDCDVAPFADWMLEHNPELCRTFQTRGNQVKGAGQFLIYLQGENPGLHHLKVPAHSALAAGGGIDPAGFVHIGEFRGKGLSVLCGIHHHEKDGTESCYSWPQDNPPIELTLAQIQWHPDIILPWGKPVHEQVFPTERGEDTLLHRAVRLVSIDFLFAHFGLLPRKKPLICSPLRKDTHPSFSVWTDKETGKQCFKDHGTNGEIQGDSYNFFKLVSGLSGSVAYHAFLQLAGLESKEEEPKPQPQSEIHMESDQKATSSPDDKTAERRAWYNRKIVRIPPPIGSDAFSGFPARFVETLAPQCECNEDSLLAHLNVVFGILLDRYCYAYYGVNTYLNDFLLVIGDTSARKGTALHKTQEFFALIDRNWTHHGITRGVSTSEGLIKAIRDPQTVLNAKGKEIIREGVSDKRLLIVESEFARILKVAERQGNPIFNTLNEAWDSPEVLNVLRATSPDMASLPHIGLVAHITNEELKSFKPVLLEGGFLNRCLLCYAKKARRIPLPKPIAWPETLLAEAREIYRTSRLPATFDLNATQPPGLYLPFSAETEEFWNPIYDAVEEDSSLQAVISKRALTHVVKLAALYARYDLKEEIHIPHLKAGLAIVEHSKECTLALFSDYSANKNADKILTALQRHRSAGLAKSSIAQHVFNHRTSTADIEEALAYLIQNGLAILEVVQGKTGAPKEVWKALI